jgi:hypothetical protein
MKRWLVVGMAAAGLAGTVGIIGSSAAAGGTAPNAAAPDKTQPPTTAAPGAVAAPTVAPSSVPPLGTSPTQPTAVPPTSLWIATTAPTTVVPITVPTTVPGPPVTGGTVPPASAFDGLAWFTEVYATLAGDDPFALVDLAERTTVRNTAADVFTIHLLGAHVADQLDGGLPMPEYTVTANGKSVQVCADVTTCTLYGDFVAPTGLLESFSVNGVPLVASASFREADVESVSVDLALCVMQPDTSVSCVLLLRSEGASAAFTWEQAVLTATDGRQFGLDVARSVFTPSVPDGGFGSARLVFPAATIDGQLTIPLVSGMTGTPTTLTLTLRAV